MKDIEHIQENIADYVGSYVEHVLKDLDFYQKDEGYKFEAVATFQKEFNLKSKNWLSVIERALKDAGNLGEKRKIGGQVLLFDILILRDERRCSQT